MADWSAKLKLPYIAAAQAQKHVTHNEALALLDAIAQLTVEGFDLVTPPALPPEGAVYALGAGATGVWAGQDGKLALAATGGWQFVDPQPGWRAAQGTELRLWDGAAWVSPDLQNLPGVGIGTSSSPSNPLSVAGAATLLTHAGAGHQVKVNKASAADTASLLLQTGWSGRAEMGTTGTDDFAIKVSPDGTAWFTALTALGSDGSLRFGGAVAAQPGTAAAPSIRFDGDSDTGLYRTAADSLGLASGGAVRARVHNGGLEVTGAMTGTAVTQSATDSTAGRLLKVGDFGLGASIPTDLTDLTAAILPGIYSIGNLATVTGGPAGATGQGTLLATRGSDGSGTFLLSLPVAAAAAQRFWHGSRSAASGAITWSLSVTYDHLLGAVSQTAGMPTGAVIERASNANGEYVRFADGTQICTLPRWLPVLTGVTTTTPATLTLTLPASFRSSTFTGQIQPLITADANTGASGWEQAVDRGRGNVSARISGSSVIVVLYADSAGFTGAQGAYNITVLGRWF